MITENNIDPQNPIHIPAKVLAGFLAGLEFKDIPENAIEMAKIILLDTIGCIAAGSETEEGKKILKSYDAANHERGCCIPGTSYSMPASLAAKVNAWLSDVLDYEDTLAGHPSATVIPAALAMAEHDNAKPQQLIKGIVCGYEAGKRMFDATQATKEVHKRFAVYHAWHGFAGGAAAIGVHGGTEEQFRSALGHACGNVNIPLWYVDYGKPAHALKANYGQMALGGVDAALCAGNDLVGPFAMISDPLRGFSYAIGSDQFFPEALSADLGIKWWMEAPAIKFFPCCAFLHCPIRAAQCVMTDNKIRKEDIFKINIKTFERVIEGFWTDIPTTSFDGQMSVQYVVAMGILGLEPGREWFTAEMLSNPEVHGLIHKMTIELDPDSEKDYWATDMELKRATVEIELNSGQKYSNTVDYALGHKNNPADIEDILHKFYHNVRGTKLEKNMEELAELILSLDKQESLERLFCLLHG